MAQSIPHYIYRVLYNKNEFLKNLEETYRST